jgi:uncharacterized protein
LTETGAAEKLADLLKLAEHGDLAAMTEAGLMLAKGALGLERDRQRAFELYKKAAEAGFRTAQYNLGCMYMDGSAGKRDYQSALHWLSMAGEAGDIDAQFSLATLYQRGLTGQVDAAAARHWYERAARGGSGRAQYDLACIYMHAVNGTNGINAGGINDRESAQDRQQAIYWFEQAAASGVSRAREHLQKLQET